MTCPEKFHIKRSVQALGIAIVLLLLSGCQPLSSLFSEEEPLAIVLPDTQSKAQQENLAIHEFDLSGGSNMVGMLVAIDTRQNDVLPDIARHFGLGYNDISIANSNVSPWTPESGSRVLLPLKFILPDSPHKGITL
ncbi:MAG: hypothetical protein NTX38_09955, partial [Methylobacter sp.]|nr:hypothetical protein [Methylobacter sp.]